MSLEQYNQLISDMLNQWQTLTKLRAKLKKRKGRKYFGYKGFGHLVYNYSNQKKIEKRKPTLYNKFEVLVSRVMRYSIREEVKVKRQEKEKL